MAILLETWKKSEHWKLKGSYNRVFMIGVVLAAIFHVVAAVFSPPYSPQPYQLRERQVEVVQLPDDVVIPPPPDEIQRPELPQEAEISDTADDDVTIAPTDFNPFAPPVIPSQSAMGSAQAEAFVAYDTPPEPVHMEAAVYPEMARQAEAEGTVMVLVTIDTTGRVIDARVTRSDAIESLQNAAVAAARRWLFRPARQRDVPVQVQIEIPFRFTLN